MEDVKLITAEELSEHNTPENAWVMIDGQVYDLAALIAELGDETPDSIMQLVENAGTDASARFHELTEGQDLLELFTPYLVGQYQIDESQVKDSPPQTFSLDAKIAASGLSSLVKTPDGVGYAYSKLVLQNKSLKEIDHLGNFLYLQYVDLSGNLIEDCSSLRSLENVMILKLQKNKMLSFSVSTRRHLITLDLSSNLLGSLLTEEGVEFYHPSLTSLNLNNNRLKSMRGIKSHPLLKQLEVRGCLLESTIGLPALPSLVVLYMAQNKISELGSFDELPELTYLHLRGNKISSLSGFSANLLRLSRLNIRDNIIKDISEISKLSVLPALMELNLKGNPVVEEEHYRHAVILALPGLMRLDKQEITDEEREEAREWDLQRKAEEQERIEAERQAELAAAQEGQDGTGEEKGNEDAEEIPNDDGDEVQDGIDEDADGGAEGDGDGDGEDEGDEDEDA